MDKLKAYWICGREINNLTATVYRKDFFIDRQCSSALLNVTATNRFVFWVNGKIAAYGPKRSHAGFKEYDTIDITQYIKQGRNSFAVTVVYSPSCALIKRDGLIAKADLLFENQTKTVITDSSWVFAPAEWYGTSGLLISNGTELQEHFDAEKCPHNWQINEYPSIAEDAKTVYCPTSWYTDADCGDYKPVTVLGPYYTDPWIDLIPTTIPQSKTIAFCPECVWQGIDSKNKFDIKENLAISFNAQSKSGEKCRLNQKVYSNKQYNIFVFDLLKTRTARPSITVKKLEGDIRIELYYSIKIDDSSPFADRGFGGANEGFCDSFTPSLQIKEWTAVTAKGFRFMTVRIAGEGQVEFTADCQLIEYPFKNERKPQIKSEILNNAWDIAANTIRSATTDYYVDTCWRENALWTYDACVTGKAAFDTFGEISMWRNSMLGVARSINQFGIPRALAIPDSNMVLIDQNLIYVIYCIEYYKITSDIDFLKEIYTSVSNMLDYCEKCVTSEHLFIPPMGSWHYIDWAKINKDPYSLPINALYVLANLSAAEIAALIGKNDKADIHNARAEKIADACRRFFDKGQNAFVCHIKPNIPIGEYNRFSFKEDDQSGAYQYNIYANCLAVKAKIGTEKMRKSAADYVASRLTPENWNWYDIGGGAFDLLLSPLLDYGKQKEVLEFLERKLTHAVNSKLPTFGETNGAGVYNSAHGWQSNVNSLIKKLYQDYNA